MACNSDESRDESRAHAASDAPDDDPDHFIPRAITAPRAGRPLRASPGGGSRRRQAGRRSDPSASSRFRPMKWRVHLAGELRELAADAQTPELIIWQEGYGYVPES